MEPKKPAIAPVVALPPKWKKIIATADQNKIEAIGEAIAHNLKTKDAEASKEFYGEISRAVLARSETLEREAAAASPSPRSPADHKIGDCRGGVECRQLMLFVAGLDKKRGTVADGPIEGAASIGDAFFEGGEAEARALGAAPLGTGSFGRGGDPPGQPERDAGDFETGTTNSARGLRINPPPLPEASASPDGEQDEIVPKGVKIAFQAATLKAALGQGLRMATLENSLIDAREPGELVRAAQRSGARASDIVLKRSGARHIDDVILVSLRAVVGWAEKYRGDWDAMPDEIRHPGPIRRIHGFIVERDDIRLIATADGKGEPLTLDEIAVAVDTVWRRGAEPVVSLDPDANDFAGPQWSRVGGVPFDSVFAEVMLEADYEMKFVTALGRNVSIPRYSSYIARVKKRGTMDEIQSRYWFTPAQPAPGQILTVPDGGIYLYDGQVVLDTEKLETATGGITGTGGRDPIAKAVARNFTDLWPEFERDFPIFRRLHALIDVSLTAAIWRTIGLRHPVLDRLAALDVPSNPVKRTYEALYHEFDFRRGRAFVAGGVDLATRLSTDAVRAIDDRVVRRLILEAKRSRHALTTRIAGVSLPVIAATGIGENARDPILKINVVLQSGDSARAYALADRLIREHPDRAEFLALRVEAAIKLGLYRLAMRDLRRIFRLTHAAEAVRQTMIRVGIRSGRLTDYARISTVDRRAVANYFTARAARLSINPARAADALAEAETAVALAPRMAEALAIRGSVHLAAKRLRRAAADLGAAINLAPKNAMFRILGARVALDSGAFRDAERHLDVAIANGEGLDVLKYITMRGLARSCIGAPPKTCKRIIRGVEQFTRKREAKPDPAKREAEPPGEMMEKAAEPARADSEKGR